MNDLVAALASYSDDPLAWVGFAFDWAEPGELSAATGPEDWQADILAHIRDQLQAGVDRTKALSEAIQIATASGHGIGKSALVSWIILWAISTFEDTRGVVTANTETQLKTKTWAELGKWYRLFIGKELFTLTATALYSVDAEHERTWRIDMVPWSVRNPEAFAGLHNAGKRILVVFDEASAIDDVIWETTEGALTDVNTQIIWLAFGNPTKNKGRFRDCFPGGRFSHRWRHRVVDSRTVTLTDKDQIKRWIEDWGEDSDFVRVRVRGVFPRIDAESFISAWLAGSAVDREIEPQWNEEVVLGVDVGRFGDDPSVIYPRRGRESLEIEIYYGIDTMALAGKVASAYIRHNACVAMIDAGGVGGGVVDRCRQLRIPVMDVDFGSKADGTNPDDRAKYANKRAEIWGALKTWLGVGRISATISGHSLVDELTGPNYGLNVREEILLESKKDMRSRGVPSPNIADALACTFAFPVVSREQSGETQQPFVAPDYNPFARERMIA